MAKKDNLGLDSRQLKEIREDLSSSKRPIYIFHDDADGLASFLLFYKKIGEGKGIVVKSHPQVDQKFIQPVNNYGPDKIFVLDIAMIDQEFIDSVKVPVVWVDHHGPFKRTNVKYYNPREKSDVLNVPASYLCYQVVQENLWIAMTGIVGDWFLTPLAKQFSEQYPDLLPGDVESAPEALFTTRIGKLAKIFNFVLKGSSHDALKYTKVLTRIKDPYEILDRKSSRGRFIYKKFERYESQYQELLKDALSKKTKSHVLRFTYPYDKTSFTGELSNELLYRFPEKVIVIARENDGVMKCSLRSGEKIALNKALESALEGIDGYGGGHEHACGCCININDFDAFVKNLSKETSKYIIS